MKKFFLGFLLFVCAAPVLLALRAGDKAIDPKSSQVSGKALRLVPYTVDRANRDKLKVLVLFNVWSDASRDSLDTLILLDEKYAGKAAFAMLSGDDRKDIAQFIGDFPRLKIPVAADDGKGIAAYMGGSMIFPKAFVIDYEGNIIWDGEVIDLPEMLESFYAGTFRRDDQKEISRQLDALQTALRSGDDAAGEKAAEAVFRLDPGNSPALRLRLFMLESTRRREDAWQLLAKLAARAPKEKKLRFFQLDMALRYPVYADKIPEILSSAENCNATAAERLAMYIRSLTGREFDPEVLSAAHKKLAALKEETAQQKYILTPDEQRMHYALSALVAFRTGKLDEAVAQQKKALAVPGLPENRELAAMLNFYERAAELAQK